MDKKIELTRSLFSKIKSSLGAVAGSFIIVAGWNWYHLNKHNHARFVLISLAMWAAVLAVYYIFKKAYLSLVQRWHRHQFWHRDFPAFIDKIFFIFSLWFLVFFSRNELLSLVYTLLVLALLFWRLQFYLSHHPEPHYWLAVNRRFFVVALFLFIVQAALQYTAYRYYILDGQARFFNIVLFRAVAMTLVWLGLFVLASFIYWKISSRWLRPLPIVLWAFLFVAFIGFWVINVGVLYYSGLYVGPAALEHARGAGEVANNQLTWYLIASAGLTAAIFIGIVRGAFHSHRLVPKRYWYWYQSAVGMAAIIGLFGLSSLQNTPERAVIAAFYNYYAGNQKVISLNPAIVSKLRRFGLFYRPEEFYVNARATVFSPTNTLKLLPERLVAKTPNIMLVFWESFSARLNGAYNPRLVDLTPGINAMAADPNTTIFKNYYNASTPTITGELSQLCSFLPPTGHEEIQDQGKIKSLRLLCLPEILKKQARFRYAASVTAVDKTYANKEGIFKSMSVDDVLGTKELKKYIAASPLSWGYSDHQMFPAVWGMMNSLSASNQEPWLMMMTTIDTHPPFNLSQDEVVYQDGRQPVLNTVHSTDDAFKKFWADFKASPLYNNTIMVVVADHAIFPAALTKDIFPKEAGQLTFYDENSFLMYIPDSVLPKEVSTYASGIDVTPTLLQILGINIPNSFEGHSIFDDRKNYPNLLGMHELGLYTNQINSQGQRQINYNIPTEIKCSSGSLSSSTPDLTLCEYLEFYKWKRQMFEQGRFWKQ